MRVLVVTEVTSATVKRGLRIHEVLDNPAGVAARHETRETEVIGTTESGQDGGVHPAEGYEGRLELVGWEHLDTEGRRDAVHIWNTMLETERAGGSTGKLLSYSDGSKKGEGADTTGTYAWRIVGAGKGHGHAALLQGGGVVHGEPSDISSTRAERLGLLAAITAMQVLEEWSRQEHLGGQDWYEARWEGEHEHRLDNKGTVTRDTTRWDTGQPGVVTHELADADVEHQTDLVKKDITPKLRVVWQKGHPEKGPDGRRRDVRSFTLHEKHIYDMDALAEEQYEKMNGAEWQLRKDWWNFPAQPQWKVQWRGREIKGNLNKQLKGLVQKERMMEYWVNKETNQEMKERDVGEGETKAANERQVRAKKRLEFLRWMDKDVMWDTTMPKGMSDSVRLAKCIGNLIRDATMEGYGAAQRSTCHLCGEETTGAGAISGHILWKCTANKKVTEARKGVRDSIKKSLSECGLTEEQTNTAGDDALGHGGTRKRGPG